MSISREDVNHVADLACLKLSEAEMERMTDVLGDVLNYMDTLNGLDTNGVVPTEHILPVQNVFRKDEIKPSLPLDDVFANAPDREANCFKVPKVLG